jgi:4-hydroxybenzoate polyprenyltransferase
MEQSRMTVDPRTATRADGVNMGLIAAVAAALRPKQWTKNAIVFAALVFDLKLMHPDLFVTVCGAFVCFCLASSAIYLINDIQDIESDRMHPKKRYRPIASGRISVRAAWCVVCALLAISLPVSFALRPTFALIVAGYVLLMVAYSLVLKHLVIVDVFAISAGFVMRAAGGAVVIAVPISPWLYVCTVLLSLFIGFGKRRHELLLLEGDAGSHRRNLDEYTPELLDHFIMICAAATVMAYSLYTFVADNLPVNHSMMLTIPFVIYAVFRYLYLVHRREAGGSPEQTLLTDLPLLSCIVLWGIVAVVILYWAS